MGRPYRDEAPTRPIAVRMSPAELDVARQAAAVNRQTLSAFVRDALSSAALECLDVEPAKRHT